MKLLCWCYTVAGIDGQTSTGCAPDPAHPGDWPQLYNLTADIGEAVNLAASMPGTVKALEARLAEIAAASVEPMQWTPPYQGESYYCADCPLRNKTGPYVPWGAWVTRTPPHAR
jgi:hypothetical protein